MHSGLRSGMEAACQRPPGGPVYRCPGKYRGGEALREIPGCGCPGGCTGGRDRGNRKTLWLRSQQGERYQRLHEDP